MAREALTKEAVKKAVDRENTKDVPVLMAKWWGEGLVEKYGDRLKILEDKYPDDVCMLWYQQPGYEESPNQNKEYRFGYKEDYTDAERHSIGDVIVLLEDWDELDQFLEHFPNPMEEGNFAEVEAMAKRNPDKYKIGCWWRIYHERFWSFRGMENLMMDYYDNMEGLKAIGEKLVEFYKVIVDRFAQIGCDAIFSSDDLGHQTGPMMSPAVFQELYFPLYKEIIDYIHEKGMKFFLHSCGDNSLLMEDLIKAGVDVFHPVQKGCMDMEETAEKYRDKISFLAGMDVQDILVNGSEEEVRKEIQAIKRVFLKDKGGLLLAMGNGIMPDAPYENIAAALEEMYKGGSNV